MSYLLRGLSKVATSPASILTNQSAPTILAINQSAPGILSINQSRGKKTRRHNQWMKPRKPLHLGRAPSKDHNYFKKNYPTDKDLVKAEEVYLTYNRLLKSLACSFQQELVAKKRENPSSESETFKWDEQGHHQMCMSYNDEINKRAAETRVAEIEASIKLRELTLERNDLVKEYESVHSSSQEYLQDLDEESKEWITLENMDEKIEEALDNPINNNFSVNYSGMIVSRKAQTV